MEQTCVISGITLGKHDPIVIISGANKQIWFAHKNHFCQFLTALELCHEAEELKLDRCKSPKSGKFEFSLKELFPAVSAAQLKIFTTWIKNDELIHQLFGADERPQLMEQTPPISNKTH